MKARKAAPKAKRASARSTAAATPVRRPAPKGKVASSKQRRQSRTLRVASRNTAEYLRQAPELENSTSKETEAVEPSLKSGRPKADSRKTLRQAVATKLPPILLEGDFLPPPASGPGEKFALGPTPPALVAETAKPSRSAEMKPARRTPAQDSGSTTTELPETRGAKRLFLTARDPHWLYAHWDLTPEQQARYNRQSRDGHLILRIHYAPPDESLALEVQVHPESRHWFAHVERADTAYTAEIGCYGKSHRWTSVARSGTTRTPPETISAKAAAEFATIPPDLSFAHLLSLAKAAGKTHEPLAHAVEALRRDGHPDLAPVEALPSASWAPAQAEALAEVIRLGATRCVWIGPPETAELLPCESASEVSSQGVAHLGGQSAVVDIVQGSLEVPAGDIDRTDVSSGSIPAGVEQSREKGFWFQVNAELIIYGATERDATVSIGGRKINLRPDGSFSCRFALPDGCYELPVVAVSADGTDERAAELHFTRSTELLGEVAASPQDPALKPPTADD